MNENELDTTEEKKRVVEQKPVVGQKSENFKKAVWRGVKPLVSPTAFLLTIVTLFGVYFTVLEWRVRLMVKDPEFLVGLVKDPEFVDSLPQECLRQGMQLHPDALAAPYPLSGLFGSGVE
jgi:hypothetical protein